MIHTFSGMISPPDAALYTGLGTRHAGLGTRPDALPESEQPAGSPTVLRREQVYGELRWRILVGEFPTRTRLGEERLATLLGVSRTPVREALARLFADRLLERYDDGGYMVAEPDLSDLSELYELRVTLELRGLTRGLEAGVSHDVAVLEPLRDGWRALRTSPPEPDPRFVEVDESFHVALAVAGGNRALTEMLQMVNARIRQVRTYDFLTPDRIEATIGQHLGIVEAVLAGELPVAVTRMRAHVGTSLEVVRGRAERAIAQMALRRGRRR